MTLGQRIKTAREAKGLSLQQLADKMNVSRQLVWQWERFTGKPQKNAADPRKHARKICDFLDIPYEYFYDGGAAEGPIEDKIRRLLPHERTVIEAAVDAFLAQRIDAKAGM